MLPPCTVCREGDDAGPIQHTDCCSRAFHVDGCARKLGVAIDFRTFGDILCAACVPKRFTLKKRRALCTTLRRKKTIGR